MARSGHDHIPVDGGDAVARLLSDRLNSVDSDSGRERLRAHLKSQPFPHYKAHPEIQGLPIRVEENGRRTVGRFVNRQFQTSQSLKYAATN